MPSNKIDRLLRRLRALRFSRMILQLLLLTGGSFLLSLLAAAIANRYLFYHPWIFVSVVGPILLFLIARSVLLFKASRPDSLAGDLDRHFGLKDRVSTYVDLKNTDHPFLSALINETESRIAVISALRCAGFRSGSAAPAAFAAVPALLLALLPYLPVPEDLAGRIEQHRRIAQEAQKLQTEAGKLDKEAEKHPEFRKLAGELERLARELQKPSTDPAEALKQMNWMQERVQDARDKSAKAQKEALADEMTRLAQEGKSPGKLGDIEKQQMEEMARELEKALSDVNLDGGKELQKALKDRKLSEGQMQKMKKSIEQYKSGQEQTEKRLAELQKSMEKAKRSASSGKSKTVYNSQIDDRKVETGKSGVEDGPGTTNQDVGPARFDTQKKGKGEYAADKTKSEYEELYKGQREDAGSDPLFLNGQWDPENARFQRIRTFGTESETGMPGGVGETVAQSSEESVTRKERVPASYRNLVKKYFDSIQ